MNHKADELSSTKQQELIAACWTTAGACLPMGDDDRSPLGIIDRVEAAAHAGFKGFGIRHRDLLDVENELGFRSFRTLLGENGIKYLELEFLEGWYAEGSERTKSDAQRADLLRAADTLGARHIKVGGHLSGGILDLKRASEEFFQLAKEAESVGTKVGLEPMPFADIKTPTMGLAIVNSAGHPAGGLFIDIWHVSRANVDFDSLSIIPADQIIGVELDDADIQIRGTLLEDTINERRFPGEGDLDIEAFVEAIKRTGYNGPWGVEMLSKDFRQLPLIDATRHAFATSIQYL
jgi:sugar phosphate isomerase/epimerase